METKDILNKIPHDLPFVFIDRILHLDEGSEGVGLKNVTVNEPCFRGHFPGNPVFPGVLILEAMAQLGGAVAASEEGSGGVLAAVSDVKFLAPVSPGDQIVLTVKVEARLGDVVRFEGTAAVGEETVAKGHFTLKLRAPRSGEDLP